MNRPIPRARPGAMIAVPHALLDDPNLSSGAVRLWMLMESPQCRNLEDAAAILRRSVQSLRPFVEELDGAGWWA